MTFSLSRSALQAFVVEHPRRFFAAMILTVLGVYAVPGTVMAQSVPEWRATRGVRIAATAEQPVEIERITQAVRTTDGMLVIADEGRRQLHVFDSRGAFVRTLGRAGEGPGEFRSMRWIGACRPSGAVVVYDVMQRRLTTVDLRTGTTRQIPAPPGARAVVQCSEDGKLVFAVPTTSGMQNARGMLVILDSTGARTSELGPYFLDAGRPLGPSIRLALGRDRLFFGAGDSAVVWGQPLPTGSPYRVTVPGPRRTPSAANTDAAIEYWATLIPGNESDYDRMRSMLRRMPPVSVLPAYSGLFLDQRTSVLWVQTSTLGDEGTILLAMTTAGKTVGRLRLPAGLEIYQVSNDHLVARESDADSGEEAVVVYRITRG